MSKYTITLKYLIDNSYDIWGSEFESTVVSSYYDTLFTADKWASLKSLFNRKYYYREIGFEVPELFTDYLQLTFVEMIDLYKSRLKAYSQLDTNPYSNAETEISEENDFEDLPMTPLDTSTHLSTRNKRTSSGKARNNVSQIEMYNEYSQKIRDLDDDFVDYFNDCFMLIY